MSKIIQSGSPIPIRPHIRIRVDFVDANFRENRHDEVIEQLADPIVFKHGNFEITIEPADTKPTKR